MGSIAAQAVAEEVLGSLGKGEKPSVTQIAIKKGYTPKTANSGAVQRTKTYQATIGAYVTRLTKHRDRVLKAMEGKDLTKEQYKTLTESLNKITHDLQLLSGGNTENIPQPIIGIALNVSVQNETPLPTRIP